jgi:hypothetical protein
MRLRVHWTNEGDYQTYKWTDVIEAHKEMEANKTMGKIIVEIS